MSDMQKETARAAVSNRASSTESEGAKGHEPENSPERGLKRWAHRLSHIFRDQRGLSAIEFALVLPVVLLLVMGTIEVAFDLMMDASLQIAAQNASRYGMTTSTPSTGTRASQAQAVATNAIGMWTKIPGTTFTIAETSYSAYSNVGTTSNTSGMGGLGDVVTYQMTLTTKGITGLLKLFGVSSLTFQRNYLIQNEQ